MGDRSGISSAQVIADTVRVSRTGQRTGTVGNKKDDCRPLGTLTGQEGQEDAHKEHQVKGQ